MHENPDPTEEEREQPPERVSEEEAMSGQGHEDPEQAEDGTDA